MTEGQRPTSGPPPVASADPGWWPLIRRLPLLLVPVVGMRAMALNRSGLDSLRMVWLTLFHTMALLWIPVVWVSRSASGGLDPQLTAVVVAGVGTVAQLLAPVLAPELDPADGGQLARSFQRATLTRVGLAQVGLAAGLVGFLGTGSLAVYGVGFVIAAAGMVNAAPTRRRLEAAQADVDRAGTGLVVVAVLTEERLGR